MKGHVFNLHSTIELPLEDLEDVLEEVTPPEGVASISQTSRENVLVIESEPESDDISPYTPTANLKATIEEKAEKSDNDDEGLWSAPPMEQEEEEEIEMITYAGFKGYGESVLYNKALHYPMFKLLCEIARHDEATGSVSGIVVSDGEMQPVKIVDGEDRHAEARVVDTSQPGHEQKGGDWQTDELI